MSLPVYGPEPRPVSFPLTAASRTSVIEHPAAVSHHHHQQATAPTLADASAPSPAMPTVSFEPQSSLVPSGFECVAHPVFLRVEPPSAVTSARRTAARRRSLVDETLPRAATAAVSASVASSSAAWAGAEDGLAALGGDLVVGGAGGGKVAGDARREVDVVCPICLGKFEQAVTLTTCLHSFCHTCILGWYEHTVAVALARGDLSAFRPSAAANPAAHFSEETGANSRSQAPAPYRCPLCQVPGPYFLGVEPAPRWRSEAAGGEDKPKLKFRLLGARTVLGGGGPASGGVEVDRADGGDPGPDATREGVPRAGAGYPSMGELRAAARTQLALAAAVSALEGGRGEEARGTAADCVDGGTAVPAEEASGSEPPLAQKERSDICKGGDRRRPFDSNSSSSSSSSSGSGGGRRGGIFARGGEASQRRRRRGGPTGDRSADEAGIGEGRRCDRSGTGVSRTDVEDTSSGWKEHRPGQRDRRRGGDGHGDNPKRKRRRESTTDGHSDGHALPGVVSGGRNCRNSRRRPSGRVELVAPYGGKSRSRRCMDSGDDEGWRRYETVSSKGRGNGSFRDGAADLWSDEVVEECLPWEPGSMAAEDALEAIEAMLERERENLRRRGIKK